MVKETVVATMVKVRKRMLSANLEHIMDQCEEILKIVDHPLGKIGTLEKLVNMTKLSNVELQSELLRFVCQSIKVAFRLAGGGGFGANSCLNTSTHKQCGWKVQESFCRCWS